MFQICEHVRLLSLKKAALCIVILQFLHLACPLKIDPASFNVQFYDGKEQTKICSQKRKLCFLVHLHFLVYVVELMRAQILSSLIVVAVMGYND